MDGLIDLYSIYIYTERERKRSIMVMIHPGGLCGPALTHRDGFKIMASSTPQEDEMCLTLTEARVGLFGSPCWP